MGTDTLSVRQAGLSPAKRALLERWKRGEAAASAGSGAIGRRDGVGPAPLSSAQQRLWFLDQLAPGNPAYNVHALAWLTGRLDRQALTRAFQEIVQRHEALRTVLRLEGGEPVQIVLPRLDLVLPRIDLSGLPAERRRAESSVGIQAEANRGFDLGSPPLLRATLLDLAGDEGEHYLLVVLHHTIADGWSLGVLLKELAAVYEAFVASRPSPLPPLPIQYSDYAAWQRQSLAEGAFAADLGYWRQELAGAPESLDLPTDHPRPALQSLRGGDCPVALEPAATAALVALSRDEEATLFMALLAIFEVLLGRYSGQEDLLVGSPVAGRGKRELEGLIGLFVHTVVLRGDLSGEPSFRQLLGRTRTTALRAYGHQELPFERLVEELKPDRDLARNPIFQVMFAFQNTPVPEFSLPGLILRQDDLESATAMFDLALSLRDRGGLVSGSLRYSADLFEAATASRLVTHLGSLLAGAAAEPDRRLSELPLLTPQERLELRAWNDTVAPLDRDVCLHQRIAVWAAETADAPAVVCGEEVLSYGELDRRANRLARRLRRLGAGPEVPVGICASRSPAMLVGILGILKSGAAYVPLDESYPTERLALMVADSRAPVLITQGQPAGRLQAEGAVVLRLDADWQEIAGEDGGALSACEVGVTAEHPAYIIYTSGSTGRPKGVACRHLSALNLMTQLGQRQPLAPGDVCSLWTSISFDVSVTEIFTTLGWGGALHIPTVEERASAEALLPWMARHRIVSAYLPPFLLGDLARWVGEGGEERRTLRRLWVGVEPIRQGLLAEIRAAVPELCILNGYGPTEATVCDTLYDVGPGSWPERRTPLGRPIGNCRIHLLDAGLQEVPAGVPGEIWIAGDVLARGYFGRPELTAEKFVPDPIGGTSAASGGRGGRCYRTGDLGRRLASGELEFLGRRDQQVKVRGFRIELEEIEAILALHPGVREAVVAVREDPRGDQHLVAYVLPHEAADLSSWRELLSRRLPAHMVPATIVHLPALPLTPAGKVDRRALPEPDWSASHGPFVAPRGPVESLLSGIWSDLLGGGPVSGTDDFFARGGHSLLATRVVARVRELFAVELPLREIFEARTLSKMAARIEELRQEGGGEAATLLPAKRGTGSLPLSFGQQRLWFMDQFEPGSILFNTPGALRLLGPLAPERLHAAIGEVVCRHEILRTIYLAIDGQPIQVIVAEMPVPMPRVDLASLPARRRDEELARRIAADVALPFDLARGPVLRTTLLLLGPEEHVLLLNLHHIAEDRWSQGIFRREIAVLYEAWSKGEPSPLPELPLQYADFALWQRRWLAGEVLDAQVDYWKRQLAGAPQILDLATDRPRPLVQSNRGSWRPITLPAELVTLLTRWGQQRGGTLFMTLLGALATMLGRAAGQEDLLVGSPIAGRDRPQLEGLIGLFVNTLVLRVDLSENPSFDELLGRVRAMALDAYAHQSLPFERLVDELAPVRDLSRSPLFQVAFALQNVPSEPLRLSGLTLVPLGVESGTAQQDLLLLLSEVDGGLDGIWEFAADLFDNSTLDRLSGHFMALLAGIVTDSERRLSELPLLSPAELQQVGWEWNATGGEYPREARVEELFAAEAAARPAAPAVVVDREVWSYGRLDEASDRLAGRLRAFGVGTETRVGISMERSAELIVGIVAILKAGGVYVPLDPGYPDGRLAFMIEDTGLSVVLVHAPTQERFAGLEAPAGLPPLRLLPVDRDEESLAEPGTLPPPPPLRRRLALELAYITYTSGSTGRPKGVQVPHRAIVRLVKKTNYIQLGREDRLAHASNISFDAATFEIWGALANGGAVVVIHREVLLSPTDFVLRLREAGVTTVFLTTALFNQMVREEPGAFSSVRHLLVGGEALDPVAMGRALAEGAPDRLLNIYGPTESTTFALWHEVREVASGATQVPIGGPIANTTAYVLDRWRALAPPGEVGELCLGGDGLARGYLNRPALTAEKFVPHPWSAEPGERLYRTGDLVRRRAEGIIEYVGRVDQQVKIRGHRIEPGEIEVALAEHPGVEACAVAVREDPPAGKVLVAYVVGPVDVQDLRAFLAAKLPAYMVPTAFVPLAALPLSPHGKVDRAALPAPGKPVSESVAAPPRMPSEVVLAGIWSGVLGRETVGIHENFFELGGDSILCVQVVSRARRAGLQLTPKDLFQHQTIAELAAICGGAEPSGEDAQGEVPLSPIQRWFFAFTSDDPHHFNQSLLLDLRQPCAPGLLAGALIQIAEHHEALGFRYSRDERGEWRQFAGEASLSLATVDLSSLPAGRRRDALETAAGRLSESLDLARGPLFRPALFQLAEGGQRLFLLAHHLIVDAVSWRVLLADLETAYQALAVGRTVALTQKGAAFRQWTSRLTDHAHSPAAAAELGYWLAPSRMAIRPLPVDRPGGDNTAASARTIVVKLEAEATQALLHDVPSTYRTRVPDALLTALVQAFAGWTGEPRLLVDLEGHGREELFPGLDVSRTVGWLTAVFPVLLELDRRSQPPGEHLKAIKEQLWSVPHGGINYGILRYLGGEAAERLRDLPVAEVLFNYLGELDAAAGEPSLFARAGEAVGRERSPRQRRSHALEVNAGIKGGRLRLLFTYSEGLHEHRTVQALADRFVAALRALIEHCRSSTKAVFTPADFKASRVSQKDLDKLMARIGKRS